MSLEISDAIDLPDLEPSADVTDPSVMPKFDMHLFTSTLGETHVEWITKAYDIPFYLHPRVAPEGIAMDELLNDVAGLVIPIATPWRHNDSSVVDPPPVYGEFDEGEVEKLREIVITLHKPHPSHRSRSRGITVRSPDLIKEAETSGTSVGRFGDLLFAPYWGLTESSRINTASNCQDMLSNLFMPANYVFQRGCIRSYSSLEILASAWSMVKELEEEKKEWLATRENQVKQIKKLEDNLAKSKKDAHQLRKEKEDLAVLCGQGEIIRHRLITGSKEAMKAIINGTDGLDPEASSKFMEKYDALFNKSGPTPEQGPHPSS
ncbi:hypothetical protein Tco_1490809 [Tanacetum coccineum]